MPEHSEIVKQDYLTTDLSIYNQKIHIIGNPPLVDSRLRPLNL